MTYLKPERGRIWIPLYVDEWLSGSTRRELTPEERAVWLDLLALAAKDGGHIREKVGVPYSKEKLAGILSIPKELLENTIQKCLKIKKLTLLMDNTLYVTQWSEEKPQSKLIPCPPQFKDMATRKGYVRKSRLIVAVALNRSLKEGEEVYHINGRKDDDRVSNLMLFQSHQDLLRFHWGSLVDPIFDGSKLSAAEISEIEARISALFPLTDP